MLSNADRNYTRYCSEQIQKLYEFARLWERHSAHHLPWVSVICSDIIKLHTRLDQFVSAWDRDPPNDDAFAPSVSGKSVWSGNF